MRWIAGATITAAGMWLMSTMDETSSRPLISADMVIVGWRWA
jgi:hypothetical protein